MSQEPKNTADLIFASMDLPLPDRARWIERVSQTPDADWFYDDYRSTKILALRTSQGETGFNGIENKPTEVFRWTSCAFPELIEYFEKHVFPWSTDRCRIAILRTPAGGVSKTHIDCAPDKVGTIQHKFRIALRGKTSTLYFETSQGKVWAPEVDQPFLIDGSWPHGMINPADEEKITVCMGAPWTYSENYPALGNYVSKNNLEAPPVSSQIFEKKYFTP